MADFKQALERTLKHEGTYSNHPLDKGGRTIFGISSKYHSQDFLKIKKLWYDGKKEEAKKKVGEVYKYNYWDPFDLDELGTQYLAEQIFDIAVNMGVCGCQRLINKACSLIDPNIEPFLTPAKIIEAVKKSDSAVLNNALIKARKSKYDDIVSRNPSQFVFHKGWIIRAESFLV